MKPRRNAPSGCIPKRTPTILRIHCRLATKRPRTFRLSGMFQTANQMAQLITSFVDSTSVAELRQGFSSTCICDT